MSVGSLRKLPFAGTIRIDQKVRLSALRLLPEHTAAFRIDMIGWE